MIPAVVAVVCYCSSSCEEEEQQQKYPTWKENGNENLDDSRRLGSVQEKSSWYKSWTLQGAGCLSVNVTVKECALFVNCKAFVSSRLTIGSTIPSFLHVPSICIADRYGGEI